MAYVKKVWVNGSDDVSAINLNHIEDGIEAVDIETGLKMNKSGGTFTGTVSHGRNLVQQPKIKDYTENLTTNATATGTVSLDLSTANVFDVTLTGITTFTFNNVATTGQTHSFTLILRQGGTAYAVTWPTSVKWASDAIPVISDVSKTSIFSFVTVNGGTRWYGTAVTKLTT